MFVAGMWFQDLWTYDFRRTEMCIIPYAHADGRDLVLRLQHGRRLAADRREDVPEREGRRLVQEHGKHAVYANPNKAVPLPSNSRPIALHIPKDGRLVEWAPKATALAYADTQTDRAVQ